MPVTFMRPNQAMRPSNVGPNLDDFPVKILSQGDSWFSIGAIPPWATSNVLMQLNFTSNVAIVTCAEPGEDLSEMSDPHENAAFISLLKGPVVTKFDAILLSGGGNDLIASLQSNLLLPQAQWGTGANPSRYVNQAALGQLAAALGQGLAAIVSLRDAGINKGVPLYINAYDYATPRNAPVSSSLEIGPWLYPAMMTAGILENEWVNVTHYLIDQMAVAYKNFCGANPNVFLVDTRGTLVPAALDTTGVSNNWENEIHPTPGGYSRLAAVWEKTLALPPLNLT